MDKELELRVKDYNKNYKQALDEFNKGKAQISVYENEINSLCAELTDMLGIEITKDNAFEIYEQKEKELRQQLEVGESIIKRIQTEANTYDTQDNLSTVQGVVASVDLQQTANANKVEETIATSTPIPNQDMGAFNGFFNTSVDDI